MYFSNQISTSINQKEVIEITNAVHKIDSTLPDLVILSDEELASLPQMNTKTIDFVYEVLELIKKHPDLVSTYVDVPEIQKNVELIEAINKILIPLRHLVKKLEDSALLAGSEAFMPSLAIYNIVKMKSKTKGKVTT